MNSDELFAKYQKLQQYVGWTEVDVARIENALPIAKPHFSALIDDFYETILKNPDANKVITGGKAQIARLKQSLLFWIEHLFCGQYDASFVEQRWRVGLRHVEIGLDQVYTNAALSRLRNGLIQSFADSMYGDREELLRTIQSLNRLLDVHQAESLPQVGFVQDLQISARRRVQHALAQ